MYNISQGQSTKLVKVACMYHTWWHSWPLLTKKGVWEKQWTNDTAHIGIPKQILQSKPQLHCRTLRHILVCTSGPTLEPPSHPWHQRTAHKNFRVHTNPLENKPEYRPYTLLPNLTPPDELDAYEISKSIPTEFPTIMSLTLSLILNLR